MKRPKYIQGDFVMVDSECLGTKDGLVYEIVPYEPNGILWSGSVPQGTEIVYRLGNPNETFGGYLFARYKHIIPIPLTIDILKKNGYEQTRHAIDKDGMEWYEYENENNELPEIQYYPKDDCSDEHFSAFWGGTEIFYDIRFVHQLQHLLFGLDIDVEFKI